MAQNTKENLEMMFKKDMVKKNGLMALNTLVHILTEWNMGMGFIIGQMAHYTKEIGIQIKFQDMVNIVGMMVELIRVIG